MTIQAILNVWMYFLYICNFAHLSLFAHISRFLSFLNIYSNNAFYLSIKNICFHLLDSIVQLCKLILFNKFSVMYDKFILPHI